jgi:hypothetical protein
MKKEELIIAAVSLAITCVLLALRQSIARGRSRGGIRILKLDGGDSRSGGR